MGLVRKLTIWAFLFFQFNYFSEKVVPASSSKGLDCQTKKYLRILDLGGPLNQVLDLWGPLNQVLGPWGRWDSWKGIQIGKELGHEFNSKFWILEIQILDLGGDIIHHYLDVSGFRASQKTRKNKQTRKKTRKTQNREKTEKTQLKNRLAYFITGGVGYYFFRDLAYLIGRGLLMAPRHYLFIWRTDPNSS